LFEVEAARLFELLLDKADAIAGIQGVQIELFGFRLFRIGLRTGRCAVAGLGVAGIGVAGALISAVAMAGDIVRDVLEGKARRVLATPIGQARASGLGILEVWKVG